MLQRCRYQPLTILGDAVADNGDDHDGDANVAGAADTDVAAAGVVLLEMQNTSVSTQVIDVGGASLLLMRDGLSKTVWLHISRPSIPLDKSMHN